MFLSCLQLKEWQRHSQRNSQLFFKNSRNSRNQFLFLHRCAFAAIFFYPAVCKAVEPISIGAFPALGTLPVKASATISTEHFAFENVWRVGAFWSCFAFFTDLFSVFLNCIKQFIANDRFMGAFGNNQIIFSSLDLLMIYNLCFSLHQITCIDFAF